MADAVWVICCWVICWLIVAGLIKASGTTERRKR
jgi:hypothetical protein